MARLGSGLRASVTRRLALTPALRRSLALLAMDAEALDRLLDETAATNPWLIRYPAPAALLPDGPAPGPGLYAHVLDWIARTLPDAPRTAIALTLAEGLEPTGWLSVTPEAVATRLGQPVETVRQVLATLQRIDPPGLFARDLAECLRLQAVALGLLDESMEAVLTRLDLLARKGSAAVARAARLPEAVVAQAVAHLRGFDPKPGLRLGPPDPVALPRATLPDLQAVQGPDGRWRASAAGAGRHIALRPGATPDDPAAAQAAELLAQVALRDRTILLVADAILDVQGSAMTGGRAALRPLTRAAIAEATGLAASTVGRAVQGVRIATPQGVWPLATFFSAALAPDTSAARAEAALRTLIRDEPPDTPLSDAALAEALAAQGIPASRRTVAKYRDRLGLPPAATRKRRPEGRDPGRMARAGHGGSMPP